MTNIPIKDIIVNDVAQCRLLEDDGTAYQAADATPSAGGFILEGFLPLVLGSKLQLLKAATRIIKDVPSAGVTHKLAYAVTTTGGGKAGDVFRLTADSLDLTPTEFQNKGYEKRYQLSTDQATNLLIVTHLVATINADKNSPVTAFAGFNNVTPVQNDTDKIVLVAKKPGVSIGLFVGEYANATGNSITLTPVALGTTVYHSVEDTNVVTALPALPINTYEYLKNINWAKNVDFDRDLNYYPLPGVDYVSYYFEVNGVVQDSVGNNPIVSEKHNDVKYGVKLWVKDNIALETAMDLLVTDMNV